MKSSIKVLIVDDSENFCNFLEQTLATDPLIHVLGHARDAYQARDLIKQYNPDVITLDVDIPGMDGLTFLRNIMRLRPMPVVMLSDLTAVGANATLDALQLGAVDFMAKRHASSDLELQHYKQEIIYRTKLAANANVSSREGSDAGLSAADYLPGSDPLPDLRSLRNKIRSGTQVNNSLAKVIAIGSSTGGPEALRHVLTGLCQSRCALAVAQHMPMRFMNTFASRLNSWSNFEIRIARDEEKVVAGRGYVAPGDHHLSIVRKGGDLVCSVTQCAKVSGHRPSVDVLFNSVADNVGSSAVGLLLTGMGDDGANGLKRMRAQGALTIVQDRDSSTVWGMPGRALAIGGADGEIGLRQLTPAMNRLLREAA